MNGVGGDSTDLYSWKEVTQPFLEACKDLTLGELLHDQMFGLFDAMSAIEMMDPKMDSGMSTNTNPLTFDEAVDKGIIPIENMKVADVIGILDESLCALVAWLEGHSLVQTVFTNLYSHNPDKIQNASLQSGIYCLLKLVGIIKNLISRAGVYEEEDHQPLIYGFRLYSGELQNITQLLKDAEEDNLKTARNLRAKGEQGEEDAGCHVALASRLKYLRLLYLGLSAIERGENSECFRNLTASRELIPSLLETVKLGRSPESGKHMLGFEPLANQRLLPPTFPRYTKMKDRASSLRYMDSMTENSLAGFSINQLHGGFHAVLNFFQDFSASSPCLLSRSILQILYSPLGLHPTSYPSSPNPNSRAQPLFQDILKDSCRDFMAPPALLPPPPRSPGQPPSPLHTLQVKQCIDTFFHQCTRPFGLLLQTCGHNRARQREKIQMILGDFLTVQEEADKIDNMLNTLSRQAEGGSGEPHALYLSTWLIYHVLRLMIRFVVSGFELELYASHEYPYVFFYLHDLLYPWLINCLHRADTTISEHNAAVEARKKDKSKKKTKSGAKKQNGKHRPYSLEIATYQANSLVCGGMLKFLVAARKEGKIQTPSKDFDDEAVRYEHRFAAFAGLLTPPLAPYSQYKEVVTMTEEIDQKDLYQIASKDFSQARQILESIQQASDTENEELRNLVTLSKTNLVVSSLMAKGAAGSRSLNFDFSLHPSYPLFKLT